MAPPTPEVELYSLDENLSQSQLPQENVQEPVDSAESSPSSGGGCCPAHDPSYENGQKDEECILCLDSLEVRSEKEAAALIRCDHGHVLCDGCAATYLKTLLNDRQAETERKLEAAAAAAVASAAAGAAAAPAANPQDYQTIEGTHPGMCGEDWGNRFPCPVVGGKIELSSIEKLRKRLVLKCAEREMGLVQSVLAEITKKATLSSYSTESDGGNDSEALSGENPQVSDPDTLPESDPSPSDQLKIVERFLRQEQVSLGERVFRLHEKVFAFLQRLNQNSLEDVERIRALEDLTDLLRYGFAVMFWAIVTVTLLCLMWIGYWHGAWYWECAAAGVSAVGTGFSTVGTLTGLNYLGNGVATGFSYVGNGALEGVTTVGSYVSEGASTTGSYVSEGVGSVGAFVGETFSESAFGKSEVVRDFKAVGRGVWNAFFGDFQWKFVEYHMKGAHLSATLL